MAVDSPQRALHLVGDLLAQREPHARSGRGEGAVRKGELDTNGAALRRQAHARRDRRAHALDLDEQDAQQHREPLRVAAHLHRGLALQHQLRGWAGPHDADASPGLAQH